MALHQGIAGFIRRRAFFRVRAFDVVNILERDRLAADSDTACLTERSNYSRAI